MKENFKKTKKRFLPLMSALALAVRIAVTENLKKIPNHMKQKTIVPALPFLLPSLFGVGVFYAVPFAVSVFFTFTQGVAHPHFAGLQNFRELWGTAVFRQALGNTVLFLTVGLCLLLALALFAALVCAKGRFAPQELALLLPMVIPVNSFALGWQSLWGQNGAVNRLLGLAGREPVDFLNGAAAFPLLVALYLIKNTGCVSLILAAVIRAVPQDYQDAYQLDSTSEWGYVRRVLLPLLTPTLLIGMLLGISNYFLMFRDNRIRLLALLAAFVLACAGCVWLFLHSGRANRRQEAEPVSASAQTAEAAALPNFAAPVLYDAQSEVTEELPDDHAWQQEIFPYGDDLVQLNYGGDDALFAAVSALTGSTVLAFPAQDFPNLGTLRCASAALAPDGTLWLLGYDETTQEFALQGSGQGEPARLGVCPFDYASPDAFAVCGDYAAVLGRIGTERILVMYDRATGQSTRKTGVQSFCFGADGTLYCVKTDGTLCAADPMQTKSLWQQELPSGSAYQQVWYSPQVGLFSCASRGGTVRLHDAETGEPTTAFFTAAENGLDYTAEGMASASFAVGADKRVLFCQITTDYDQQPIESRRITRVFLPRTASNAAVTLTITAPYPAQGLLSCVRLYQSRHPEVEIVWDTAYDTVSDYSAHWEQYAEQLSLRLMSGDVGDIVLLNGSGLEVSAVLESDAMADLTPYLEQCPYRDELDEELLQPLTNSAGRLCGVPLGVSPQYLIYNETLGQSLGLTWDTDALTWKDLLDLATVWQAAGEASPSLFCTGTARDPDSILEDFLLANLDSFSDAAAAAALEPQLAALQALWDGDTLMRAGTDGRFWSDGFFENVLFTMGSAANYENLLENLTAAEQASQCTLRLVPIPLGENASRRQNYAVSWGISERSGNKEAAWALLEATLGEDGFVNDIYSKDYALVNRVADRQRYEAIFAARHSVQPQERHYAQYRAVCLQPTSRYSEPNNWKACVLAPIQEAVTGTASLDEAIQTAVTNWNRERVE